MAKCATSKFTRAIGTDGRPLLYSLIHDITDRRRLQAERRKLSQAVEQSPASIVITDLEGRIEYANHQFLQITGYTLEEVLGQNPRILKSGETSLEEYQGTECHQSWADLAGRAAQPEKEWRTVLGTGAHLTDVRRAGPADPLSGASRKTSPPRKLLRMPCGRVKSVCNGCWRGPMTAFGTGIS